YQRRGGQHRFTATQAIRNEAEQRTTNDPSKRDGRRTQHRSSIVNAVCLLQKPHAPDHVEDGGGDKKQSRNESAENRLRISENNPETARNSFQSARGFAFVFFGNQEKKRDADQQSDDAHADPELVPRHAGADERSHHELAGRTAGHPEHLRRANQGGRLTSGNVSA